jgi:hypothetical protein
MIRASRSRSDGSWRESSRTMAGIGTKGDCRDGRMEPPPERCDGRGARHRRSALTRGCLGLLAFDLTERPNESERHQSDDPAVKGRN